MAGKNYSDELMRASARPDAAEIRNAVRVYFEYFKYSGKEQQDFFDKNNSIIEMFHLIDDDPDLGIALVVVAASMYDDPHFLFFVAAGPLENILRKPSCETIDRVVAEARKNARLRWMLTGVFLHAISDQARPRITAVIGTMTENDPVPPRLS